MRSTEAVIDQPPKYPQESSFCCVEQFHQDKKRHSAIMTSSTILPTNVAPPALDEICINTLRFLAVDMVQKAKSGHPGLPLGSASMAYTLWDRFLKFNPRDPFWPDRDRFVLSAGHGCALLYALLHVTGFDLPLEELERFRQWGSRTPGHPEYGKTPGVEATTGPLGQGLANAVGMAIAEVALAARFNRPGHRIVDHYTYVLASDGDLEEGVSSEAGSEAGHLRLGKLIVLYANNHITIEGSTELAFTEDRMARFAAFGWHVQRVEQSNDVDAVALALTAAQEERGSAILDFSSHPHRFRQSPQTRYRSGPRRAARCGGGPPDQRGTGLACDSSVPYSRTRPWSISEKQSREEVPRRRNGHHVLRRSRKRIPNWLLNSSGSSTANFRKVGTPISRHSPRRTPQWQPASHRVRQWPF